MIRTPSLLAVAVALVLGATGCGDDTSSGSRAATDVAAVSEPAAAKVASFSCPAGATSIGSTETTASRTSGDRLKVITTVAPITSILANIAGDRAEVIGVVPEGQNSHEFEPKPSVASTLSDGDVIFMNGLKLESPTKTMAEENLKSGAQIVELGTLSLTEDQYLYDFSFPKDGGKPNPHLWTNPPMARCYAEIAGSTLAAADPANAEYYQSNTAQFQAKIDELDRLMIEATTSVPETNRKLLTYHDAYAYFAAHYGWTVVGAVELSTFEDPSPKDIAALIEQIREEKVPAVFGSEVFPSPVLEQLAKEAGVTYVDKLRDDDLPGAPGEAEHSFLGLMKFDFVTMVSTLGGDASGLQAFDATDVVVDSADYPQ